MAQKARNRKPVGQEKGGVPSPRGKSSLNSEHINTNSINFGLIFLVIAGFLAGGLITFLFYPYISNIVTMYSEDRSEAIIKEQTSTKFKGQEQKDIPRKSEKLKQNSDVDKDNLEVNELSNMEDEEILPTSEEFTVLDEDESDEEETEEEKTVLNEKSKLPKQEIKMEKSKPPPKKSETKSNTGTPTERPIKLSAESTNKSPAKPSLDSAPEIPKEVKEFKATFQTSVTPKKIFQDGRRIPPVELLPQKPNNSSVKVFLFDEFFSEAECDGLMKAHNKHVSDSSEVGDPIVCFDSISTLKKHLKDAGKAKVRVTPNDFTPGTTCANATFSRQLKEWLKGNWSYSTAFYPGESRFTQAFDFRAKEAMGLEPKHGGKFQLTSYPSEAAYKTHTDCVVGGTDKRDRMASVLVYLTTVEEGGETTFPDLGIWVRPRKGRALVWNNMNEKGECEPLSMHTANKVEKGNKVILIRWYYYKSFYSLGKRPPEPELPPRQAGQARVSCDEYEFGSCRWYDEWNYDHLLDYQQQMHTLI